MALIWDSVTCLRTAATKDCLRCADLLELTHTLHSTALSSCSHPDKFAKQSCWNSCFSCWAQLSGRTWTLHVGWNITKGQERSSGPALRASQALSSRHISLLLPKKFRLQFCLNARDVFSHVSVLSFCHGGRDVNNRHRGHKALRTEKSAVAHTECRYCCEFSQCAFNKNDHLYI